MTVGTLDRKTMYMLFIGLAVIGILRFGVYGDRDGQVATPSESIPRAQQRLEKVRQLAAMLPGKKSVLARANADLAIREKGLLLADTVAQAQGQLLTLIQQVAASNGFNAAGAEIPSAKPLANDYGEVSVIVSFTCGIDQLVNFLAAIANEPQVLATNEITVSGGADKKKNLQVRLSLSGVVPKKLLPVKKAGRLVLNRKLLLLDVVLVAVVVYVGFQLRNARQAAKAREAATLAIRVPPLPPPPFNPLPAEPPVTPSGYVNIADKMLFDRSRNSIVIVEPPPVPPPKPMPALPVYHGMMNLGSAGPTAFFSATAEAQHQAIHIGETIGQFKLLSVNSDEISLEWDGKVINKKVAELSGHTIAPVAQAAQDVRTDATPAAAAAPPAPVKSGPGEATAFGFKTCAVNDGNAEGTVTDGYKKVMHTSPFGTNCTWEPVGK